MPQRYEFKCSELNPVLRESVIACKFKPKEGIKKVKETIKEAIEETEEKEFKPQTRNILDSITDFIDDDTFSYVNNIIDTINPNPIKAIASSLSLEGNTYYSGASRVGQRIQASSELTNDEIVKAKMTEASYIYYEEGYEAAQKYLTDNNIEYIIDRELSNKEGLVLTFEDDYKIVYRGTNPKSVNDVLVTDGAILIGIEDKTPQFKQSKQQVDDVISKYGRVDEFVGYSFGGNKSIAMHEYMNVTYGTQSKTTAYNPFLGNKLLLNKANVPHNIIRTTDDMASIGIGLVRGKNNWNVKSVKPIKNSIKPWDAHLAYHFFTNEEERADGLMTELATKSQNEGIKLGEYEMMYEMNKSILNGESFTEHIHKFNTQGGQSSLDTNNDGTRLAGKRMHENSSHSKIWAELGGYFEDHEIEHFNQFEGEGGNKDFTLTKLEREQFINMSDANKIKTLNNQNKTLKNTNENLNKLINPQLEHVNYVNKTLEPYHESIKSALHPTNLLTGLVGGYVANQTLDVIDHDHSIPEYLRTTLEGGVAGGLTAGSAAALAGSVAGASVLAAGAAVGASSYIAGELVTEGTTYGLEQLGVDENISEGIGSATGGAAAGLTGVLAAVAIDSALGLEMGSALGPAGMVVGSAVGAILGIAGYLLGNGTDTDNYDTEKMHQEAETAAFENYTPVNMEQVDELYDLYDSLNEENP